MDENQRLVAEIRVLEQQRDAASDRADQLAAVLHQVAISLERDAPAVEGRASESRKSDRDVARSMIRSALAYDAKQPGGGEAAAAARAAAKQGGDVGGGK